MNTSKTPITDFIEQSSLFKAVQQERDDLLKTVAELETDLTNMKDKMEYLQDAKQSRSSDRAKLIDGVEAARALNDSDLNSDLKFELMSILFRGVLREVGAE